MQFHLCASKFPKIGCGEVRVPRSCFKHSTTAMWLVTESANKPIYDSSAAPEGMTPFFTSMVAGPVNDSPFANWTTLAVMLRFTIALCSRIMKNDHRRMSSSTPLMGGTSTQSCPPFSDKPSAKRKYCPRRIVLRANAFSRLVKMKSVRTAALMMRLLIGIPPNVHDVWMSKGQLLLAPWSIPSRRK